MQYHLLDLIHSELIDVGIQAASDEAAIRAVCALMMQTGYAGPGFDDDVVRREKTFPTGLPTAPVAVAIPHADPDHVERSAVAIGVLAKPVPFGQMGTDGSVKVDAAVVFVLAIKEQEKQTELLQELIGLLQSPAFLSTIVKAGAPGDVLQAVEESLV